nr:hypothetical protein CFP56_23982 [Quercus suber]
MSSQFSRLGGNQPSTSTGNAIVLMMALCWYQSRVSCELDHACIDFMSNILSLSFDKTIDEPCNYSKRGPVTAGIDSFCCELVMLLGRA